jgi:hypothetical protein
LATVPVNSGFKIFNPEFAKAVAKGDGKFTAEARETQRSAEGLLLVT